MPAGTRRKHREQNMPVSISKAGSSAPVTSSRPGDSGRSDCSAGAAAGACSPMASLANRARFCVFLAPFFTRPLLALAGDQGFGLGGICESDDEISSGSVLCLLFALWPPVSPPGLFVPAVPGADPPDPD